MGWTKYGSFVDFPMLKNVGSAELGEAWNEIIDTEIEENRTGGHIPFAVNEAMRHTDIWADGYSQMRSNGNIYFFRTPIGQRDTNAIITNLPIYKNGTFRLHFVTMVAYLDVCGIDYGGVMVDNVVNNMILNSLLINCRFTYGQFFASTELIAIDPYPIFLQLLWFREKDPLRCV